MELTILGCGSAMPTLLHKPSCQVIEHAGSLYMIDCGEGSQLEMRRARLPYAKLRHILISHLHGDHCLGLPGLISTMALHEVTGKVTIHIFARGIEMMRQVLATVCHKPSFEIEYNILDPQGGQTVIDTHSLTVKTFKLDHAGVDSVGFRFDEKPKLRHLRGDMADFHAIPLWQRRQIKEGADFVKADGSVIPNEILTTPPDPAVSYAYASDTAYCPAIIDAVKEVDLLYHEATYDDALESQALSRGHSTARQAALIARDAHVGQLLIGHYSKRYNDTALLLNQAREVFPNTLAAEEGMKIRINYKQ